MLRLFGILVLIGTSSAAFASGGIVNWYDEGYRFLMGPHYNSEAAEQFVVICGGLFTLSVCTLAGLLYSRSIANAGDDIVPDGKMGIRTALDMAMDLVVGMAKDNLGHAWKTFAPLLAGVFLYIFVSNLGGLVPGFIPATESLSNNLAIGLMVFIIYNIAGLVEHKAAYMKQFTGPVLWLAPMMLMIELVGHMFRPVSLSLRLMGNIYADHFLVGLFTSGVPYIIIPSALMFFGLLVALIQSFVFTLLTSVYISMAVSHDH